MVGGLFAAIIGPQVVIWTRDALPATPFAGSFYSQAVLALLALPLLMGLRLPPTATREVAGEARPLSEIARTPQFITAATAGVVSYGLMAFLMTAAPMAMVGCGHSVGEAALGIQWHVLAMFAPSFVTGRLIARFGKRRITALGLIMIAMAGGLALLGLELLHFWGALILLGVGWNFGFIGATALLTECYRPAERAKVQAFNDFLVFGTVAVASFGSGELLHTAGWNGINYGMLPLVAVVLLMLYLWIFFRAIEIFRRCGTAFPGLLVLGLALLITCQALLHIMVTVNLIPETGQTLPLISRGGSSVLFTTIARGMSLSVSRQNDEQSHDRPKNEELRIGD